MLGKRKREATVVSRPAEQEDDPLAVPPNSHDLLRKYFEAQFEPLDVPQKGKASVANSPDTESDDDKEDSEWSGISDDDGDDTSPSDTVPEVVDHSTSHNITKDGFEKELRKQFMSAKPPSSSQMKSKTTAKRNTNASDGDEGADDAMNLKNDLALQRLLKESHLLESVDDLNPTGKNRHRALDIRMQTIGANDSIYMQKKMPMSHRKGIEAKVAKKDATRRREAKENGIILEKPTPKRKVSSARRERGIGGPSVGKFSGGTLRLSKRDLADIQGPRTMSKGKKRGRR
ncbi:hypothetical protein CPC735_026200 [Coccidioides posadasii C735 delta SOWgp]|uniref:Protein FAF1 n=1 Tax=Coccidioides posadasii (strain C735) TaxID=222929 RepID=C5P784_COCP7|nr:hypothetical protein CPC735_026200 [Coccidioides posadasii C735 delta SOWgp]EER27284.1 hypothetical protein CPC735_026200 [Coccidioides posadasii C735 delta SOWgp]|eukprot:XP_003069429.1 hypothetical protein CPC735_026200 [Coccidioides posadasii C735 delta SOWgp]